MTDSEKLTIILAPSISGGLISWYPRGFTPPGRFHSDGNPEQLDRQSSTVDSIKTRKSMVIGAMFTHGMIWRRN